MTLRGAADPAVLTKPVLTSAAPKVMELSGEDEDEHGLARLRDGSRRGLQVGSRRRGDADTSSGKDPTTQESLRPGRRLPLRQAMRKPGPERALAAAGDDFHNLASTVCRPSRDWWKSSKGAVGVSPNAASTGSSLGDERAVLLPADGAPGA